MKTGKRIVISGGGTGGHIFPAVSIARALQRIAPDTEILFVGAQGRMEMEKVPASGFKIIGLDIQGFNRKSLLKNWNLPFKLLGSLRKANKILSDFKPHVAVGVGGYASGPLLYAAGNQNIPYIIQEQNSYAGITNKKLSKKANKICVAFENMDKFFPANKILLTGNPIRRESVDIQGKREEALEFFNLSAKRKTILLTGGSLGSLTLNNSAFGAINKIIDRDLQLIWQCGSYYYELFKNKLLQGSEDQIKLFPFLQRMDLAYAAADVIISRAGAGTIAELCVVGKPVVLVPSPNVAEDHQTINARALADKDAAVVVTDDNAQEFLIDVVIELLNNEVHCTDLALNIMRMAIYNADEVIADEVLKLAEQN
ncbi:undecaprenyldiphospho-muramoylpentapeptide beta-N-acetylglucosaminyltransferase [Albibacterium bauzanense]|uniref:UDP-N-acetylglucosamine--N-acetylmuramyl-(pentapeptide) pyrophosphoryl-undecaprenol N-acetylglucosamine transferase n=1 Tax=Albibacterium bauzanense TaxID=653929 RepID=A0A4R1LWI9_9SPHI|nr:undecaprenyldiphospho-muramoylpentapeptide beta-N-acetylglucosaminyltransferase [Albibacterium bauzanense]TCK83525.1 UDP-N-acetylglucosamine-N-acetylmuramylpentapeptide N-acetylglucosamine transferase [Albibacterium bauzanense]